MSLPARSLKSRKDSLWIDFPERDGIPLVWPQGQPAHRAYRPQAPCPGDHALPVPACASAAPCRPCRHPQPNRERNDKRRKVHAPRPQIATRRSVIGHHHDHSSVYDACEHHRPTRNSIGAIPDLVIRECSDCPNAVVPIPWNKPEHERYGKDETDGGRNGKGLLDHAASNPKLRLKGISQRIFSISLNFSLTRSRWEPTGLTE